MILGLLPLAVGFNIDFEGLFTHLRPNIFFGGDSVVFWGPLSWTIIFGLLFSFFLTLVMVPSMYLIAERLKRPRRRVDRSEHLYPRPTGSTREHAKEETPDLDLHRSTGADDRTFRLELRGVPARCEGAVRQAWRGPREVPDERRAR